MPDAAHDSTVAIIPARSGSKSVPDKNIADLAGHPVLAYSIAVARLSQEIDRVLVSTDINDYADLAREYGAEAPFLRPAELASDTAGDLEVLRHVMDWMNDHEHHVPEYWVYLRPSTPLRDPVLVDQAIRQFKDAGEAVSLRSAHPAPESPRKWFRKLGDNFFPLMDGVTMTETDQPNEAFATAFVPDGYADVFKASQVRGRGALHGDRIMAFVSPVSTEIDSAEELDYLRHQLERNGSPLLEFLNKGERGGTP